MDHKPKEKYGFLTDFTLTWKTLRQNKPELLWGRGIPWRPAGASWLEQSLLFLLFSYGGWIWIPWVKEKGIVRGGNPVGGGWRISDVDYEKSRNKITILDVRLLFSKSALMGFGETIQIWGWSSISPGLSVSLYLANRELCRSLWVCLRTVWWAKCNSEEVLNPFAPGVELVRETLRKAVPAVSFPVNSKS